MSTIPQQIQALKNNITSLRALVNGSRDQGKLFAIAGDFCVYGCKITEGASAADMYLALAGQAAGDESHQNPDIDATPIRHEEFANIALIYGELFEMPDVNVADESSDSLLLDDAPGTAGFGRYDVVYAYIGQSGPAVAILTGTASAAVKTAFDGDGLDTASYPSTYDPTLPVGTFPLARVYVEVGDTGIPNSQIADIRDFKGRMNPIARTGKFLAHTGSGLGAVNTAARIFTTVVENACPGITYSTSANNGAKLTATEPGEYEVEFTDIGQDTSSYIGLSVNSAQLTTSVESADVGDVETRIIRTASGLTKLNGRVASRIRLEVGDFIVPHCTIGTYTGESNLTRLMIRKVMDI